MWPDKQCRHWHMCRLSLCSSYVYNTELHRSLICCIAPNITGLSFISLIWGWTSRLDNISWFRTFTVRWILIFWFWGFTRCVGWISWRRFGNHSQLIQPTHRVKPQNQNISRYYFFLKCTAHYVRPPAPFSIKTDRVYFYQTLCYF